METLYKVYVSILEGRMGREIERRVFRKGKQPTERDGGGKTPLHAQLPRLRFDIHCQYWQHCKSVLIYMAVNFQRVFAFMTS